MPTSYQIKDQQALHYLTLQVVDWIDIFTRQRYRDIVVESIIYCQKNKGLQVLGKSNNLRSGERRFGKRSQRLRLAGHARAKSKMSNLVRILFYALLSTFIYSCNSNDRTTSPFILPFNQVIKKTDIIFQGIKFLSADTLSNPGVIRSGFNYSNNTSGKNISFDIGLAAVSVYYATGDSKYLKIAKETASLLDSLLPENGLIPQYSLDKQIIPNSTLYPGTWGQSNILCFVCALSAIDSSYKPLCKRLADGLLNFCINPANNLVYFQVCCSNGQPYDSKETGYESQLGSSSCEVAQALLFAFKTLPGEKKYQYTSLRILRSIWELRNPKTDLVPECYNVYYSRKADRLYPSGQFRLDDMGGAYLRALTLAYQQTHDPEIRMILNRYVNALILYTWDTNIGCGGGFRYLTDLAGKGPPEVETMYGLFIASLLEASQYVDQETKKQIVSKCREHADHVFLTGYGVKNFMIPHIVSRGGEYTSKQNDSQLAYAVVQFPLGMSLLTQVTNDYNYVFRTNQTINTLLNRHKKGDNITSPLGFVNILETQPPFNFEKDYSSPSWCYQVMYLSSYMLFASIIPNNQVKINWLYDNSPCVFGLVAGMPFWDIRKVNFEMNERNLNLNDVIADDRGEINFDLLGYSGIDKVFCDGKRYFSFDGNKLITRKGHHSYKVYFIFFATTVNTLS